MFSAPGIAYQSNPFTHNQFQTVLLYTSLNSSASCTISIFWGFSRQKVKRISQKGILKVQIPDLPLKWNEKSGSDQQKIGIMVE